MRFVILRSTDGQFYFQIVAANNQVMLVSETYRQKKSVLKAIAALKKITSKTKVIDKSL